MLSKIKIFRLVFFLNFIPLVVLSLPINTKVCMGLGRKPQYVDDLVVGNHILGYSKKLIDFDSVKIKKIETEIFTKLIKIETNKGIILSGKRQRFYDPIKNEFLMAKDLSLINHLLGIDCKIYKIKKVKKVENINMLREYHITIGKPHIFYIYDSNRNTVLVHNGSRAAKNSETSSVRVGGSIQVDGSAANTIATIGVIAISAIAWGGYKGVCALHSWLKDPGEPKITYYKLLGVSKEDTKKEIIKKYNFLIPKLNIDDDATDKKIFKILEEAYNCLSDNKLRKVYDESLKNGKYQDFHSNIDKEIIQKINEIHRKQIKKIKS